MVFMFLNLTIAHEPRVNRGRTKFNNLINLTQNKIHALNLIKIGIKCPFSVINSGLNRRVWENGIMRRRGQEAIVNCFGLMPTRSSSTLAGGAISTLF
jgi:hypothetical protein